VRAVHSRQQPVDDHGVGPRRARLVEAFYAAGRPVDFKTAIGELGRNFLGRFAVILDQKYSCHQFILARR